SHRTYQAHAKLHQVFGLVIRMILGQDAAQPHAEQRAAIHAEKYNCANFVRIHDFSECSPIRVLLLVNSDQVSPLVHMMRSSDVQPKRPQAWSRSNLFFMFASLIQSSE